MFDIHNIIIVLLAVVVVGFAANSVMQKNNLDSMKNKVWAGYATVAKNYEDSNDLMAARNSLAVAIQTDKNNPWLYLGYGKVLLKLGYFSDSYDAFVNAKNVTERLLKANPNDATLNALLLEIKENSIKAQKYMRGE